MAKYHDDAGAVAAIQPRVDVAQRFLAVARGNNWPEMLEVGPHQEPYHTAVQYLTGALNAGGPRPAAARHAFVDAVRAQLQQEIPGHPDTIAVILNAVIALLVRTQAREDGESGSNEREFSLAYAPWEPIAPSANIDPDGAARR